ncbi:hypothetical protein B0T16DRAFT_402549 [Cercophora newfieldiana]|uniref:Uncharacterized protein n=1 Tax=Cercophora newfieldiana TaxID=92897 RepID=A0AA40D241_9PEZI|nr:hypothetical protein B0T16DRAFT_402549 [Cercophora newfieldiana]
MDDFTALSEADMDSFLSTYPQFAGFINGEDEIPNSGTDLGDDQYLEDGNISVFSYRSTRSIADTEWGNVSYIDQGGHMDTYDNAYARIGSERVLQQCSWVPMPRRGRARSNVPELVLTTPSGDDHGLDDLAFYPCANAWADMDDDDEY